jgi:hypothetical protein
MRRLAPDFVVAGRPFWRLRKRPGSRGMLFWLTEEADGGREDSELAFDIRTLPLWQEKFGHLDDLSVGFREYPLIVGDAIARGIDLIAHSTAWWNSYAEAAAGRRHLADDLDTDVPF